MARSGSRGARLAVREARLITKELRLLGVKPGTIAKTWSVVLGVPVLLLLGYLMLHYDAGTADPTILNGVHISYKSTYEWHVRNGTPITLKSLTVLCSAGGDKQPVTSITSLYPPLHSGFGEDAYIGAGCQLIRVNESHQLW